MSDLDTARLDWIDPNHYSRGQRVEVVETDEAGVGTVTFELAEGETALRFNLSANRRFSCIAQRKVADGVILHFGRESTLRALHLVELKSKLGLSQWRDAKVQLQGALHNAHALLGLLGLQCPQKIVCHTAYKQDALSTNPALLKAPIGARIETVDGADWVQGVVEIDDRFPRLRHCRHQRDDGGNAVVALHV